MKAYVPSKNPSRTSNCFHQNFFLKRYCWLLSLISPVRTELVSLNSCPSRLSFPQTKVWLESKLNTHEYISLCLKFIQWFFIYLLILIGCNRKIYIECLDHKILAWKEKEARIERCWRRKKIAMEGNILHVAEFLLVLQELYFFQLNCNNSHFKD